MEEEKSLIAIGLRVTPQAVYYAIISKDGESFVVMSADQIKCPMALGEPACLKHLRQTVFGLIGEFKAKFGGIKLIENNSRTKDSFRLNIEGVMQEAFASSTLKHYFFGAIPKLNGVFKLKNKATIKRVIDGEETFDHLDLGKYRKEHREAILAAIGSFLEHGH